MLQTKIYSVDYYLINSMIGFLLVFAILSSQLVLGQNKPYNKVVHNLDPNAKCLDGSPAALYLSQGDPQNILVHFMGGASCSQTDLSQTIESCYQRSRTFLGSSLYWPQNNQFYGILSNDLTKNIFANWTKAVFIYCDGVFHQGNSSSSIKYKDGELFFRGSVITKAHLKFLDNKYNLTQTKKMVLTGTSAGGIATFIWADYIKKILPNPDTQFYPLPESSIFLNPSAEMQLRTYKRFDGKVNENDPLKILMGLSNKQENVPNEECLQTVGKQNQWTCLSIQIAYKFLKNEQLFLQPSYDQYLIKNYLNYTCLTPGVSGYSLQKCSDEQRKVLEDYRQFYLSFAKKLLDKGHSIWTISCVWHSVSHYDEFYSSALQKVPQRSGATMQEAAYEFVFENKKVLSIDLEAWPANTACAF